MQQQQNVPSAKEQWMEGIILYSAADFPAEEQ